jgi:hypothetical protein
MGLSSDVLPALRKSMQRLLDQSELLSSASSAPSHCPLRRT